MKHENNRIIRKRWIPLIFVIALFSACGSGEEVKPETNATPTPSVTPTATPSNTDDHTLREKPTPHPESKGQNDANQEKNNISGTSWYEWLVIPGLAFFTLLNGVRLLVAWKLRQRIEEIAVQLEEIAVQQKNHEGQLSTQQHRLDDILDWLIQNAQQSFSRQQEYDEHTQGKLDDLIEQVKTTKWQSESLPPRIHTPKSSPSPNEVNTRIRTASLSPPKTKFPISVANYLRDKKSLPRFRVGGHRGLVEDEHGSFVIVLDGEEIWAIPFAERFESSYDFDNVSTFYGCSIPSGGEVILVRPAIVEENMTGVYQLQEKGELQIVR